MCERSCKRRAESDDLVLNRGHAWPRWFTSADKLAQSKTEQPVIKIEFSIPHFIQKMNSTDIISKYMF